MSYKRPDDELEGVEEGDDLEPKKITSDEGGDADDAYHNADDDDDDLADEFSEGEGSW